MNTPIFLGQQGPHTAPTLPFFLHQGPHTIPNGGSQEGENEPDEQWAPVIDRTNAWVQVSGKQACMQYDPDQKGGGPGWGITGASNEAVTR